MTENFAKLLYRLREKSGLSKTALGERIGVTLTSVYNWERGSRGAPPIERVRQIAQALKATPEETEALLRLAALERAPDEAGFFRTLADLADSHDAPQSDMWAPLPLYRQIPDGPPAEVHDYGEVYYVLKHLAKPGRYVYWVSGNSIPPKIENDDRIMLEHCEDRGEPVAAFNGEICSVRVDGTMRLARIRVLGEDGREVVVLDDGDGNEETLLASERGFAVVAVALTLVGRDLSPRAES